MWATQDGKRDIVSILIENEADVNLRANDGNTALILAASYGHVEVLHQLIAYQADVNSKPLKDLQP